MKVLGGLLSHQVLQRNSRNVSETTIFGTCNSAGTLQVRVTKNNKPLPGLNWKKVGAIKSGAFKTVVAGIPVGGPYQVSLRIVAKDGQTQGQYQADDILVGDVWILGGQSNMEGIGLLKDRAKPQPHVRAFYMHDKWAPAKDPIHNLYQAVDQVHTDLAGGVPCVRGVGVGVGPGVGFGQEMFSRTGVPQGLLSCAHGGTSMSQWDPALKDLGSKSLYGATLRRFHKNGARVAGVIWYQGCSDTNPTDSKLYTERMKTLVAAFRKDLKSPKLPFVMVQIASFFPGPNDPGQNKCWNSVQDQERLLPKVIKNLATVPAVDLSLDDCIHISGADQHRLGRRLAQATLALMKNRKAGKLPIELKSIKPVKPGNSTFEITFDNVEGKLQSAGRPAGFAFVNPDGSLFQTIYRIDLEGNKVILKTGLTADMEEGSLPIAYGYGIWAYCNITDSRDRSLPVFAPQPTGLPQLARASVNTLRVSNILPGAGKLHKVKCPRPTDTKLGFKSRTFPNSFANLHEELQKETADTLVFFASEFECTEPMKLQVGLGYDGPVKMWIDRKQVFHDPKGINPMIFDQAKIKFNAKKGKHEIIVAFSPNYGKAWGIALRLYRKDLAKKQLKTGRPPFILPKILG
jgi:hypothetical protein